MPAKDSDMDMLEKIIKSKEDKISANDLLLFIVAAMYTVALPLFLFISILDLPLSDPTTMAITAIFGIFALIVLFKQYNTTRETTIQEYSNDLKEWTKKLSRKKNAKVPKTEASTPAIAKKAVAFSLFYNNGIYLFCMAFFGMYFLRSQAVTINYGVSTIFSCLICVVAKEFTQ